jgi:hypothetical protein
MFGGIHTYFYLMIDYFSKMVLSINEYTHIDILMSYEIIYQIFKFVNDVKNNFNFEKLKKRDVNILKALRIYK